jgi:ribA/ribD-fused uncharacterized protein
MEKPIDCFRGEHYFLSNFYPCDITYDGLTYFSSEAAYQAQKTTDKLLRRKFSLLSAADAKKLSHEIDIRKDWSDIKVTVMREILYNKFTNHADLKELLIKTGDIELIEGNTWNDTFWGVCNGQGKNMLGKLLMEVRFYLKNDDIFEY